MEEISNKSKRKIYKDLGVKNHIYLPYNKRVLLPMKAVIIVLLSSLVTVLGVFTLYVKYKPKPTPQPKTYTQYQMDSVINVWKYERALPAERHLRNLGYDYPKNK